MTSNFLNTEDAAKKLGGLSPRTLEKWRMTGNGPTFHKFGKKVLYAEEDLKAWADEQRHSNTSAA